MAHYPGGAHIRGPPTDASKRAQRSSATGVPCPWDGCLGHVLPRHPVVYERGLTHVLQRPRHPKGAHRRLRSGHPATAGTSSAQPLAEDLVQGCRGLLIQSHHTTVRHVWVQHNDPVLLGHQQVRKPRRTVRSAGGHDHPAVVAACTVLVALAHLRSICRASSHERNPGRIDTLILVDRVLTRRTRIDHDLDRLGNGPQLRFSCLVRRTNGMS
jgi:hypothetical protein